MESFGTPARTFYPGIGQAVADRTISRLKTDGSRETWADVALRVAEGSVSLHPNALGQTVEFGPLHHHLRQASVLMSGRHLQHGDTSQPTRNQEVFTNCSTAASSFLLFYLLLNGSGVGRSYDDDMMLVDWCKNMPYVRAVLADNHPDVLSGEIKNPNDKPVPMEGTSHAIYFRVPDSREGWAKAIEQIEVMTWEGDKANHVLFIDFTNVRERGAPINGMQKRPASGPGPLIETIRSIAALKGQNMLPWRSTLEVDHLLAECVLVGGARRAARMATKTWTDLSAMDFVSVKKGGILWSSNNSVTVDEDFWRYVKMTGTEVSELADYEQLRAICAQRLFESICSASYHDGTGEPGLINVEQLTQKDDGIEVLMDGDYAESERLKLYPATKLMTAAIAKVFAKKRFTQITNPCGEISLAMLGGYCVIADVVPYHASADEDAEDAFRVATRALIRTNTMDCLYSKEVERTNRIGVGITGVHEYAWARFGYSFRDIINEEKSMDFWLMLARFSNASVDEARTYSARLGLNMPHTVTTMKPAGTTSKLFGLTEGAHLPSMREYLRWVQFRNDDPLIAEYETKGYPVRKLTTYSGTTIVGFPTVPTIVTLGMGDKLVTAAEATPEEQYQYLRLMEKYWLHGGVEHDFANQCSYTLKFDPAVVSYEQFKQTLRDGQSTVKCCSVMPQIDTTSYEYQPEEPVTAERFKTIVAAINDKDVHEEVGLEHVDCGAGGCPIDFA